MLRFLPLICLLATALTSPVAAQSPAQAGAGRQTEPVPGAAAARQQDNAIVRVGACTGTLIAPDIVLTAAHCVPQPLRSLAADPQSCPNMPGFAAVSKQPGGDPFTWYPASFGLPVQFGPGPGAGPEGSTRFTAEYALPRCADMALIRLDAPVPPQIATPHKVITRAPSPRAFERALIGGPLRHAGFGRPFKEPPNQAVLREGRVSYWSRNACALVALPPLHRGGDRIATGDSGAPLLLRQPDGAEVVVAVIWGRNPPDGAACGVPRPFPPLMHGAYTPTVRGPIEGTNATDISLWLETMAPEAVTDLP